MPLSSHRLALVASHLLVVAACVATTAAAQAGTVQTIDPMTALRERLAARLGAVPVPPNADVGVLKVTSSGEGAPADRAAGRPAAPRKPSLAGRFSPPVAAAGPQRPTAPLSSASDAADCNAVQFYDRASGSRVVDNGHTIQGHVAPGNATQPEPHPRAALPAERAAAPGAARATHQSVEPSETVPHPSTSSTP